jgi:hypothetical protein
MNSGEINLPQAIHFGLISFCKFGKSGIDGSGSLSAFAASKINHPIKIN